MKPIDPETRAQWAEARRELERAIERLDAKLQARREDEERRRQRLRRLTFGLLRGA
jgi:chaperonin cofactor prefoldin